MRSALEFVMGSPSSLVDAYRRFSPLERIEVEVRLDWRCNARCSFCGVWKYDRSDRLSCDDWCRLLRDWSQCGLRRVLFTGGEPLLCPYFLKVIEVVDSLGIQTAVITNGSFLDEGAVMRLGALEHLEEITVSVDSAEAAVHDRVRNTKGLFERAMAGMMRVRAIAPHVPLIVNTVVSSATLASLANILTLPVTPDGLRVIPVGIDHGWLERLDVGEDTGWRSWAASARAQSMDSEMLQVARESLERVRVDAGRLGVQVQTIRVDHDGPFLGVCFVPLAHFVVQPNGDVFPCCHIQSPSRRVGQLREQSVAEMIEGDIYRRFLESVRPVSLPTCRSCSRYREFNEAVWRVFEDSTTNDDWPRL